jgi:hypothetical protein
MTTASRGLFRLWIVATVVWVIVVCGVTPLPDEFRWDWELFLKVVAASLGPPILLLPVGAALLWAVRGFRP